MSYQDCLLRSITELVAITKVSWEALCTSTGYLSSSVDTLCTICFYQDAYRKYLYTCQKILAELTKEINGEFDHLFVD